MPRYLIAVHHPDGYDPSIREDDAMRQAIDALNDEMAKAGIVLFVGGLKPPAEAQSIRATGEGTLVISNEPYLGNGEHVAGFWVVEAPDSAAARAWGRKAAIACRAGIEIRPFH